MPTKKLASPKALSTSVIVAPPNIDEKALTKQAEMLSTQINTIAVKDQATYNLASQALISVKQWIAQLEGHFGPSKKALNAAVLNLRNEEKRLIGPRLAFAEQLERSIKGKMSTFLQIEEDRKRKEAREEQARKDKEAEAERKKLEKKADKAEEKGKDAAADQLRLQAAAVVSAPVAVAPAVSYAGTGTTSRDDISVEIVDARLFLKYLLDSGAPVADMIDFRYAKVKKFVEGLEVTEGETVQTAPGIKVEKKKIINARA